MHKQIAFALLISTTIANHAMNLSIQKETQLIRQQSANIYFAAVMNNQKINTAQKNPQNPNTLELPTGTIQLPSLFIVTKAKL